QLRRAGERAEEVDALVEELLRAGEVADDPVGDADRVDADRLRGGEALPPCELERLLERGHRDVGVVRRDAELAAELERAPRRAGVADLGGDRVALLGVRDPAAE